MVPSVVKIIRRDEFVAFLRSHGEACWNATNSLAEEYKSAFSGARSLALSGSVAGRVARLSPTMTWRSLRRLRGRRSRGRLGSSRKTS